MTPDEIRDAHLLVARCAMEIVRIATDPDRDFGALLDEMPRRQVRDLTKQIFFWIEQIEQEAFVRRNIAEASATAERIGHMLQNLAAKIAAQEPK